MLYDMFTSLPAGGHYCNHPSCHLELQNSVTLHYFSSCPNTASCDIFMQCKLGSKAVRKHAARHRTTYGRRTLHMADYCLASIQAHLSSFPSLFSELWTPVSAAAQVCSFRFLIDCFRGTLAIRRA